MSVNHEKTVTTMWSMACLVVVIAGCGVGGDSSIGQVSSLVPGDDPATLQLSQNSFRYRAFRLLPAA